MDEIREITPPTPEPPEPSEPSYIDGKSTDDTPKFEFAEGFDENTFNQAYYEANPMADTTDVLNRDTKFEFAEGFDANTFNQAYYEVNPMADATDVFSHEENSFEFAEGFDENTMNQDINKAEGNINGLSDDFVNNEKLFDADTGRINYPDKGGAVEGTEKLYGSAEDFKSEYGDDIKITRRGSHDGDYFGVGDISYEESALAQEEDYFDETTCEYQIESLPDDCKLKVGEVAEWEEADREGGGEQLQFVKFDDEGNEIGTYSVSDLEYEGHIKRV